MVICLIAKYSNYATKSGVKRSTGADTSEFAKMVDLGSLKSEVDKIDISKLKTDPVDISKLSHVIKMMLLKILQMMNWLKELIILIKTKS